MLKWAFNEPRQSYLPNSSDQIRAASLHELHQMPSAVFYAQATNTPTSQLSRWQSVDSTNCLQQNKENQITSTPLLACTSPGSYKELSQQELCLRKLDSLKDLSNIYPENVSVTPQRSKHRSSPKRHHQIRNASTLPTLDVNEYSPSSALISGPMLALRGISISDAYFNKPRYLETTPTIQNSVQKNDRDLKLTANCVAAVEIEVDRSMNKSLSSSQMDDSTLEHMIDAIIASSHKEPKMPNRLYRQGNGARRPSRTMSPTYTPAFDPASDLDEVWWSAERRYRQGNKSCEQLLCTPKSHKSQLLESSFKRRRQRPVRRKRKLKSFRKTVQNSARKLLRVGSNVSVVMPQLNEVDEGSSEPSHVSLSPDSGHNSSSGDSSKIEDHEGNEGHHHQHHKPNIDAYEALNEVEVTKRRLSFVKNAL